MRFRYLISFFLLLVVIAETSCKKLVDVGPPVTQLVTTSVFSNDNTAIAAQLAVYTQMQLLPWNLEVVTALSSDEFTNYSSAQTDIDLYKNNLNATGDASGLFWSEAYNLIYQENAIMQNMAGSSGISNNTKKLTLGEAEFVRAYWYFYLVNLYGDVPLVTSTDYKVNSVMSRTPKAQVYSQIIADLSDAQSKLSANYLGATDTTITPDRVRPTTWAAAALLARTYLYTGNYDSAAIEASIVIKNTALFSLPALNAVFQKNSLEAIWEIMPPTATLYTPEGSYYILTKSPASSSSLSNCCTISPQLLNVFEAGDKRRSSWIDSLTSAGTTFYFPYKYKNNSATTINAGGEYSMVLRLAEQYLIRAEAEAQQNDLTDAINDINAIRQRAGVPLLNSTLNQIQVFAAIAHERQVELFTEAQRWLDLKRTNVVDSMMNIVTPQKGGTWNSDQQLYPLLPTDVQTGINLMQNPGY